MKNTYRFYCLSLLMMGTLSAYSQSEGNTADSTLVTRVAPTKPAVKTRSVAGRVLVAGTKAPLSGAMVAAAGINGFSVLTEEDGTFSLSIPVYASAIEVTSPDYNKVQVGLNAGETVGDIYVYSNSVAGLYEDGDNILGNVSANDFGLSSAVNISSEIGNRLGAHVRSISRSGVPGVGSYMTMGGINSLMSNAQPLVVIDDVIIDQQYGRSVIHDGFYNDFLTNFNVNDIEEVKVMTNGTALYGAKGANGVIFIKTKHNSSLATRIDATASVGVELVPSMPDMMSGRQFKTYASQLLKTTGTTATDFKFLNPDPDYYYYNKYNNNTNWSDYLYREAVTQNYGISVQGGGEIANYNLSLGYTMAQSTLEENDMDRLNIRFNTDIKLSKVLGVRFDASFANITRDLRDIGAPESYDNGTVTSTNFLGLVKSPMLSPFSYVNGRIFTEHYDITDEDYLNEAFGGRNNINYRLANPLAINEYGSAENKNRFENSFVNISVTPKWQINSHLALSTLFSYSLVNINDKYYVPMNGVPSYYVKALESTVDNEIRALFSKQNAVTSDTRLSWDNSYGPHNIHLLGGFRYMNDSYSLNTQLGYNTGNDKTPFIGNCNIRSTEGTSDAWASFTWYGQAEYNYMHRYFVEGDLAVESSSVFGRNAKDGFKLGGVVWGVFPSVQAGWMLTNEKWFNVKYIDRFKLIAGYGMSGNDNIAFDASRTYFKSALLLNKVTGLTLGNIGNTEVQWETTKRFNIGFDMNLLNNRMNVNFNYFKSKTDNLLTYKELKAITGLDYNWSNSGSLENHGLNATLSGQIIAGRNWNWVLGASVGHYKNKLTSLPDGNTYMDTDTYGAVVRSAVGNPVNMFYGYQTAKTSNGHIVYATTEEAKADGLYVMDANGKDKHYFGAGDVKFVDRNGDGCIDEKDRTFIGDPNPDIYGNIFTTLSYKRLKLDINFSYSLGNDVYNYQRAQLESGSRFFNQTTAMLGRWTAEGQATDMPQPTWEDPLGNARFSDRWIENGSYLRLKTLTLSYDIPINSTFIQGLTIWGQGSNLLTFTKYLGSDPEFSMGNSVFDQGIDRGLLPHGRSFTLGVKINL